MLRVAYISSGPLVKPIKKFSAKEQLHQDALLATANWSINAKKKAKAMFKAKWQEIEAKAKKHNIDLDKLLNEAEG